MDSATTEFIDALPFILLPVSAELAALHAARTLRAHQHFCPSCGAHSIPRTKVARLHSTHAVTSVCLACGHKSQSSFQKGDISAFPSARKRRQTTTETQTSLTSTPSEQHKLPPISISSRHPGGGKQKKKTSLAEMLHRNREKERARAKATSPQAGLSAFLSTL